MNEEGYGKPSKAFVGQPPGDRSLNELRFWLCRKRHAKKKKQQEMVTSRWFESGVNPPWSPVGLDVSRSSINYWYDRLWHLLCYIFEFQQTGLWDAIDPTAPPDVRVRGVSASRAWEPATKD